MMDNNKEIQTNDSDNLINFLIDLVITYGRITGETKNTLKLTFGRYPKTIINSNFKKTLEEKFLSKAMNETGNTYTFPVNQYIILTYKEYEYKNRLFIRIEDDQKNIFWVEVREVNWTINLRRNLLSLEKDNFTLFSLINQSTSKEEFITNFFLEDLLQSYGNDIKIKFLNQIKERKIREKQKNKSKERNKEKKKDITYFSNSNNNNQERKKVVNNAKKTQSLQKEEAEKLPESSSSAKEIENTHLDTVVIEEENRSFDKNCIDNSKEKIEFENNNSSTIEQNTTNLGQNNTLDYEDDSFLNSSEIEEDSQEETVEVQEYVDNNYLNTTAIEEENTEDFSTVNVEEPIEEEKQSFDKNCIDNSKEKIEFKNNDSSTIEQNTTNLGQNNILDYEEDSFLNFSEIEDNGQEKTVEVQEYVDNNYLNTTAIEEENTEDFSTVNVEESIEEENRSFDKKHASTLKAIESENHVHLSLVEQNNNLFLQLDKNQFDFSILSTDMARNLKKNKRTKNRMFAEFTLFSAFNYNFKCNWWDNPSYGTYWTSTPYESYGGTEGRYIVSYDEKHDEFPAYDFDSNFIGTRPIIKFKNVDFLKNANINPDGISIDLGTQPQDNIPYDLQQKLESAYQEYQEYQEFHNLNRNVKKYSYLSLLHNGKEEKLIEFEYKNRKFVRLELPGLNESFLKLYYPDGILENTSYDKEATGACYISWIEVKPLRWIILDDETLLAEKIFFACRPYHNDKNHKEVTLEESSLFSWMNNNLVEELFSKKPSVVIDEKKKLKEFKALLQWSLRDQEIREMLKELMKEVYQEEQPLTKKRKKK